MFFDVRVEPLPRFIQRLCGECSRREARNVGKTFDWLIKQLKKAWPGKADAVQRILFDEAAAGGLVGHVRIDRFGVLKELREFAREVGDDLIESGLVAADPHPFAHLLNLGDADGMLLPIKFGHPLQIEVKGRGFPYPIGSSVVLRSELDVLNRRLRVEDTFNLANMPEFIEASEEQIERMEKQYGLDPSFWTKFGLVILRRLTTLALEHRLPVIFHYEP